MQDAIILVNKPKGLSSNRVLQHVKRLVGAKKAGHTGSLDPLATGMLPICLGRATKVCEYLLARDKAYLARIKLGETTTTGDQEGEVLAKKTVPRFDNASIVAVLQAFSGKIKQVPPMYSALKHQGQPLYKLARAGVEIDRPAREVSIYSLELQKLVLPFVDIRVVCSKGTYIRTLAEDIGKNLGVGAHLSSLHRLYCGGFETYPMYHLDEISAWVDQGEHSKFRLSIETAFTKLPMLRITDRQWQTIIYGQPIAFNETEDGLYRIYCQANFLGLLLIKAGQTASRKIICSEHL